MNQYRIFFGTLKRGFSLYRELTLHKNKAIRYIKDVTLKGYEMFDIGYPIIKQGNGEVIGELFYIADKSLLAKLDKLCISDDYGMIKKTVRLGKKKPNTAHTFIYTDNTSYLIKIKDGRFKFNE